MNVHNKHVRPSVRKMTDADARHLLADGLLRACHIHGPSRVAVEAGCDEKTIRRARDEESTLHLASVLNLLDIDQRALDALMAAKGKMLVPMMDQAPDIVTSAGATLHRIGQARCHASEGGPVETDAELIAMEAEADAMLASALELRSRISAAKLRRAAA